MNLTRRILIAAASSAVLTFSIGNAQAQSWAGTPEDEVAIGKLYDTAVKAGENELVIYGAYAAIFRPVWDAFTTRFPKITIVGNAVAGAQLTSKIDAEFASGQHAADIVTSGLTELIATVDQDRAVAFMPPNAAGLPDRYKDPKGRFMLNYAELYGVVYNKDMLKIEDLPKSPADLLDPKYKKSLIIDDPAGGRTAELTWIELYQSGKIDEKWIKAMKEQTIVVPSTAPYFNQLTTGTVSMIPWGGHARYLGLKTAGANVGFYAVPGLAVPVMAGTVVMKNAPHENAAKLFQAWFISPEGQDAIVKFGNSYGLTPTVTLPDNVEDWPKLAPIAAELKAVTPEEFTKAREEFKKVTSATFAQ